MLIQVSTCPASFHQLYSMTKPAILPEAASSRRRRAIRMRLRSWGRMVRRKAKGKLQKAKGKNQGRGHSLKVLVRLGCAVFKNAFFLDFCLLPLQFAFCLCFSSLVPGLLPRHDRDERPSLEPVHVERRVPALGLRLVRVKGPLAVGAEYCDVGRSAWGERSAIEAEHARRTYSEKFHHVRKRDAAGVYQLFE